MDRNSLNQKYRNNRAPKNSQKTDIIYVNEVEKVAQLIEVVITHTCNI